MNPEKTPVFKRFKSYQTLRTEIYWALEAVRSHTSLNSAGGKGELFRVMFKGHQAAEEFGLSAARLSYILKYGLAPYFKQMVMSELLPAKGSPRLPRKFVTGFDESECRVTFSKQMDVHILFYDEGTKRVKRVYIGSQFMSKSKHEDLVEEFKSSHKELDLVNDLIQISMDGPHVNWCFHRALSELRKAENPDAPDLLEIGSCGLHVVHGSFGTGVKETDWAMGKKLKAAWTIFKKPQHEDLIISHLMK